MSSSKTPPELPAAIDRYEIRAFLGGGTFGAVYRAFDPRLDRDVALKVLRPEMTTSLQAVERFLREAKAAAKLFHPHIVPVYDAGRAGTDYYIASAFIQGQTLAAAIPKGGMEAHRAAELAAQLASALGYAHRQRVLHRDVKPANIMLDEQESLYLMDFGLAAWMQEEGTRLTQDGAIMGTPAYMSPEQACGENDAVGPAADLYSAGVVLYELLTGRRPFEGHPAALVYQIVNKAAAPPSHYRPVLDPRLDAICVKALAKEPGKRFTSGQEMAAALQGVGKPAPRSEPTPEAPPRARSPENDLTPSDYSALATPRLSPAEKAQSWRGSRFPWMLLGLAPLAMLAVLAVLAVVFSLLPPAGQTPKDTPVVHSDLPPTLVPHPGTEPSPPAAAPFDAAEAKRLQQAWADYLGVPVEREVELGGGVTIKLKLVPPGRFTMGSPKEEEGRNDDEGPQHEVEITRAFYIGANPVTKAQFAAFADSEPYRTEAEADGQGGWGYNATTHKVEGRDPKYTWKNPGWEQTDVHPVVNVTWKDAHNFCAWLSKKEGKRYELPREAEWEYACRAGTITRFWCGDADASLKGNANIADASLKEKYPNASWAVSWVDGYPFTSPVGTFNPNPWGLCDMHGNVWQWCADGFGNYLSGYTKDPEGNDKSNRRVIRGSSWCYRPRDCRSGRRNHEAPGYRDYDLGFRVMLCSPARAP